MSQSVAATLENAGAEKQYHHALNQGVFEIPVCTDCQQTHFYPRMICPHCGSDALKWTTPSGRGVVYSTTVIRRKPEAGGDYNVAIIDLAEGPRLMSRVEGLAPDAVKIGMSVQAHVQVTDGVGQLIFKVGA